MSKPRYNPTFVINEVTGKNRERFDPEDVIEFVKDYRPLVERESGQQAYTPRETQGAGQ